MTPTMEGKDIVNGIIYDELIKGVIRKQSKIRFRQIIEEMASRGAEGIILGCTEIPLLVRPEDTDLQLFDTTLIHAEAALEFAIS